MLDDDHDSLNDNLSTLFSAHAYDPDNATTAQSAPAGFSKVVVAILMGLAVAAAALLFIKLRRADNDDRMEMTNAERIAVIRGDWILRVDAESGAVVAQSIDGMTARSVRAGEMLGGRVLRGVRVDAVLTDDADWQSVGAWNTELRAALRGECEAIAGRFTTGGLNSSDIQRLGFLGHRGETRALTLLESIASLGGEHGAIALELLNDGKEVVSVRQLIERAYSNTERISRSAVRALAKNDSLLARQSLRDLALKGEEHAAMNAVNELAHTRDRYDAGLWQALNADAESEKVRAAAADILAGIVPDLPGEDGNESK